MPLHNSILSLLIVFLPCFSTPALASDVSSEEHRSRTCHPACSSAARCRDDGQCVITLKKAEKPRRFAVLFNPGALITVPAMTGGNIWPLAFAAQAGIGYVGGDLQLTLFTGGGTPSHLVEIGLRLHPAGKGLKGFYLAARIGHWFTRMEGADSNAAGPKEMAVTGSGEMGFTLTRGPLVTSVGGIVLYADHEVIPMFNLSLGVGF